MKTIDWTEPKESRTEHLGRKPNALTYTADRVLVGQCPECTAPLVCFNDHESWPLVACSCSWKGDTLSLLDGVLYRIGENPEPI